MFMFLVIVVCCIVALFAPVAIMTLFTFFRASVRITRIAGCVVFLAEVLWISWTVHSINRNEVARWERLQAEFPLESLDQRLEYETRDEPSAVNAGSRPVDPVVLSSHVEAELKSNETPVQNEFDRVWALRQLHEQTAEEFVGAFGFGFARMRGSIQSRLEHFERFRQEDEPLIDQPFDPADPFPTTYDYEEPIIPTPSSIAELTGLHRAGKRDFLDQRRMGFVASFRQAVEFHAHQFAKPPKSPTLKLVRLELMSLLKQTTPRVYVSRHLPSMTELPTVPTRPLDDFEARVLPRLTAEEDVVIESTPTHTRMLGSLRAGNQCLECHSVERGDLLGVFSYVLQP